LTGSAEINIAEEVSKLQGKIDKLLVQAYSKLTPWQKTQVARHHDRPHALEYVTALIDDFTPLAGDRQFAEDSAVIGGLGRFKGNSVVVLGHEKGSGTEGRLKHNFGMARPEGYRKAQRLMMLADRFTLPVITLIDTPGAYPGVDAEARGQAEAIARSIETCVGLRVPIVSVIIGEGGSGGAMALAAANTILMQEHAIYSVISPEGCASILWRDSEKNEDAANALKLTADDLLELGVIDKIISEPTGVAHRNKQAAIATVGTTIEDALVELSGIDGSILKTRRREKFLEMGSKGLS
jgi:acetyl-CoA carboxylase carboxyl transferase subunit alpha